jgi:putative spermidine/putrescine transport system substrate-binding protein
VPPGEVYRTLETEAGVTRAFARLGSIRRNILWWRSPREAIALLTGGQARIGTALTAEVEAQARQAELPLTGPQFYEADVLAIPKGDPKKEMALDYLRFATSSAPLADMVKFAPYAPPRRSSRALVAGLAAGPMRDFVVAQGDALERGFAVDDAWWRAHGAALEQRFAAWADAP